jgi:hypothetical protein
MKKNSFSLRFLYILWLLFGCFYFLVLTVGCESEDVDLELESNCYNWPEQEFSPTNRASITTLKQGIQAIDFTLKDTSGQSHTLFSLLGTKPVLLVFGAFT